MAAGASDFDSGFVERNGRPADGSASLFPLVVKDKVAAVFGCWTSVSRKNVLAAFEDNDGLLFYPVQYEGNESSKNVVYSGAAPNQQILPAVEWLIDTKKYKTFYLLGTDYVFPRTANLIIVKYLESHRGEFEDSLCELLRIPSGPVGYGPTVTTFDHFQARGAFVESPSGRFAQPRVPFKITNVAPRPFTRAPAFTRVCTSVQSASVCMRPSATTARGNRSLVNMTPWPTKTPSPIPTPSQMKA